MRFKERVGLIMVYFAEPIIGGDSIIEGFDCRVSFNIIDFNKNKEYVMNDTLLHVIHY